MSLENKIKTKRQICLRETRHANSRLINVEDDNEKIYRCRDCGAIYLVPVPHNKSKRILRIDNDNKCYS